MMVIIGAIIVIGVIYLLLKRHESRMVLMHGFCYGYEIYRL